jgi:IS30 family transposase
LWKARLRTKAGAALITEKAKEYGHTTNTSRNLARIDEKLRQDWSPEQFSGWLKKNTDAEVSHEWIYQHIYKDKRSGGSLYKHLRCQKKRQKRAGDYDRRGKIPNQVSIEDRPEIVEQRNGLEIGQVDTIISAGRHGSIVTLVDRKSCFTLLKQVPNRIGAVVENTILDLLKLYQVSTHTITFDNGKEFANHLTIAQMIHSEVYITHPYASWERGTNENTNGLIRQYFPKGSELLPITPDHISFVKERFNDLSRKCLDFQTPHLVFLMYHPVTLDP